MPESVIVGIEDALSGATVRRNYSTATPLQQDGWPASNATDQMIGLRHKAPAADSRHVDTLYRLAADRFVGAYGVLGHNLTAKGAFQLVASPPGDHAVRPVWHTDGVDDFAATTADIPQHADFSILARLFIPPPSVDTQTSNGIPLIQIEGTTGTNERFLLGWRGVTTEKVRLYARLTHSGSTVAELIPDSGGVTDFLFHGFEYDLAFTYLDSSREFTYWVNGVKIGSVTASAAWVDEGLQLMRLGRLGAAGTEYAPAGYRNLAMYSSVLPDSQIKTYPHLVLANSEKDLVASWHWLTSASPVPDVMGNAELTLTGGQWKDRANTKSVGSHDSGIRESRGQWKTQNMLRVKEGTEVTSPVLGTAPRELTVAAAIQVKPDFPTGNDALGKNVLTVGASDASYEVRYQLTDGVLTCQSTRNSDDQSIAWEDVTDSRVVFARSVIRTDVLDNSTLDFYVSSDGAAEIHVGSVSVNAYNAAANMLLVIGHSSNNVGSLVGRVRIYAGVRTFEEVNLSGPADLSDPQLLESLELDGEVESDVADRTYTTANTSYELVENPFSERPSPGRDGLGYQRTEGVQHQINRMLGSLSADMLVSEIYLQLWDRTNPAVTIGATIAWSTQRPDRNRVQGSRRKFKKPLAERAESGAPWLGNDYAADGVSLRLEYLLNNLEAEAEVDELVRRLQRLRGDLLIFVQFDPKVPQYLIPDRAVVGVTGQIEEPEDTDNHFSATEVRIDGVL